MAKIVNSREAYKGLFLDVVRTVGVYPECQRGSYWVAYTDSHGKDVAYEASTKKELVSKITEALGDRRRIRYEPRRISNSEESEA